MEKRAGKVIGVALAGILAGLLLGACIICAVTGTKFTELFSAANTSETSTVLSTETNTAPTEAPVTETTVTTSPTTITTVAKNQLVLPKDSEYIERHDVEIWSDEIEYNDYINIRYGPSKENYDVVKKVQNGTMGYGLTDSVNGWVLVEIEGTKGWVRDDLVIHYEDGMPDGIAKPVLYLYPEKTIDVSVKLALKEKYSWIGPFFLITGMVTVYFDFLTTETLSLLVPLLLILRVSRVQGKEWWLMAAKSCIAWLIGYLGMWLMKWGLASVILGIDVKPAVVFF